MDTSFHAWFRQYGPTAVVSFVLVGVFVFLSISTFLRWRGVQYIGTVVQLVPPTLTISNPAGEVRTVEWDEQTVLRRGRVTDVMPAVGDVIIVVGVGNEDKVIHARMIRILDPRRADARHLLPEGTPAP
ncbi:MAG: hypothetical protein KBD24_01295 [Candidatus Pacebacteria bacterium]|nr:hypothetical protein [Candidatus Paceibacterota bacterium]